MKTQREDNSRATVQAPEEHADAILGRLREALVPEEEFPIQGPALAPKRSPKRAAVRFVARAHVALQVMTRNQFVKYGGPREMNVVAAHAHHFLLVAHSIGRVRNADRLAASEEWIHELAFGRHHLHAPTFARERRHSYKLVLLDVFDRLESQIADQFRLFAGLNVQPLDVFERLVPIVA